MNRRGFFRSVAALVGAASVSPTIFIPKFEPVHWKRGLTQEYLDTLADDLKGKDFYGCWQFITYIQGPNGMWVIDQQAKIPVKGKSVRCEIKMGQISFTDVETF